MNDELIEYTRNRIKQNFRRTVVEGRDEKEAAEIKAEREAAEAERERQKQISGD